MGSGEALNEHVTGDELERLVALRLGLLLVGRILGGLLLGHGLGIRRIGVLGIPLFDAVGRERQFVLGNGSRT